MKEQDLIGAINQPLLREWRAERILIIEGRTEGRLSKGFNIFFEPDEGRHVPLWSSIETKRMAIFLEAVAFQLAAREEIGV